MHLCSAVRRCRLSFRYIITLFQVLFVMIVSCGLSEAQDCLACGITSCSIRNNTCLTTWQEAELQGDINGDAKRAIERRTDRREDQLDPSLNMCCACNLWQMVWFAENLIVWEYQPLYSNPGVWGVHVSA